MATTVAEIQAKLNLATGQFDAAIASAEAKLAGFSNAARANSVSLEDAASAAGRVTRAFMVVGAAIGVAGGFAVKSAADYEQNRIAFETMLGSADKARVLLSQISDFARRTPFTLPEVVEGSRRLLAFGISADKIIPTFTTLGNIAAGVGKEKLPQLVLAFGQVKAAGHLTGMELRQFSEAGVPLLDALAARFGKSTKEIQDMVSAGKIGFPDLEGALNDLGNGSGRFAGLMERQSKSLSGLFSNLQDDIGRIARNIIGISDTGDIREGSIFAGLRDSAANLVAWLDAHAEDISRWINNIVNATMRLAPVIAFVFGSLIGVQAAAKVASFGKDILTLVKAFGLLGAGFNPVSLAIMLLVGAVVLMVTHWGKVKPVIDKVVGVMTEIGTKIWNFIKPAVDVLVNIFKQLQMVVTTLLIPAFQYLFDKLQPYMPLLKWLAIALGVMIIVPILALAAILITLATVAAIVVAGIAAAFGFMANVVSSLFNWVIDNVSRGAGVLWGAITATFNAIASVVGSVIGTIVGVISWGINTAVSIFATIWRAVGVVAGAIGSVASTIWNGINNALNTVRNFIGNFVSAGWDIIQGIIRGIGNGANAVKDKVIEIAKGALDAVKNFFGIHSPSRVMAEIGKNMMTGWAQGINDNAALVTNALGIQMPDMTAAAGVGGAGGVNLTQNFYPKSLSQSDLDLASSAGRYEIGMRIRGQ